MRELPTGWQIKRLDELCEIARGGSPRPIKQFLTDDPNGINWIKISDATASNKYIYETKEKIKPEGIKRSRLVKEGDLLLSNSMSFGRPYIMKMTGCIHDGWLVLRNKSGQFDQDYLYNFLGSPAAYKQFDSLAAGSTVRNLNIDLVKEVQVLLPPLPEQKRIVTILDEAFASISQAVANAEKNLANARELFKSYLNNIFTEKGEGWVEKRLVDLSENLHQGLNTAGEKIKFIETGYPIIQTRNINNGVIDYDEKIKYMCEEDWNKYKKKYRPQIGDVFFTNIGTIGKTAVVTSEHEYLIHWNIFKIQPLSEQVTPFFLKYNLDFLTSSGFFKRMQKGGTVDFVTKKMMCEAVVSLPPLKQQIFIVNQINKWASETQRLETIYQNKLTALTKLKQSILQQAFSGELTTDTAQQQVNG